ncbi:transposase [Streptomyces sp. NBC_01433]|uniref:transposase n=1 Tax=Streptomyces sp. NBC_01433 TaxID=2903864 RepID=UPI002B1CB554|nr:transposase [Streptomyces sp. NBC_01433]
MFADMNPSANGRPSIPPQILAAVITLQARHGLSDFETVQELRCDLRRKPARTGPARHGVRSVAAGLLPPPTGPFGSAGTVNRTSSSCGGEGVGAGPPLTTAPDQCGHPHRGSGASNLMRNWTSNLISNLLGDWISNPYATPVPGSARSRGTGRRRRPPR